MDKIQKGKITKGIGGRYAVTCDGKKYDCYVQKKVRYFYDEIMVGDNVNFCKMGKTNVITAILPRTNNLKRPAVSNVDEVLVVVAPKPEPDLCLVDKLIVNCNKQSVPVTLIINIHEEAAANRRGGCRIINYYGYEKILIYISICHTALMRWMPRGGCGFCNQY